MNPKTLLGEFKLVKLGLETLSGLVIMVSLLFIIDGFAPASLANTIFDEPQAGVFTGILFLTGSAVIGILLDSIFHTFGRRHLRWLDPSIENEFVFRKNVMESVGLSERDFEWIYKTNDTGLSKDTETDLMRYIEVAGTTAYALIFAAPATAVFLVGQLDGSQVNALLVATLISFIGLALIFTSARSIVKYERRKTSSVLDDLRKLGYPDVSSDPPTSKEYIPKPWFLHYFIPPFFLLIAGYLINKIGSEKKERFSNVPTERKAPRAIITAFYTSIGYITIAVGSAALFIYPLGSSLSEDGMIQISTKINDNTPVPVIAIVATIEDDMKNKSSSLHVTLNNRIPHNQKLALRDNELVSALRTSRLGDWLQWRVYVSLEHHANDLFNPGDPVVINALLSFTKTDEVGAPLMDQSKALSVWGRHVANSAKKISGINEEKKKEIDNILSEFDNLTVPSGTSLASVMTYFNELSPILTRLATFVGKTSDPELNPLTLALTSSADALKVLIGEHLHLSDRTENSLTSSEVDEGTWTFPIVVEVGDKKDPRLLALAQVTINRKSE